MFLSKYGLKCALQWPLDMGFLKLLSFFLIFVRPGLFFGQMHCSHLRKLFHLAGFEGFKAKFLSLSY